jgi:hypothetical protein
MVDKKKIMLLLKKYFDTSVDVTIDDDGLVSCTGNVVLKKITVTHLPVQFKQVDGYFDCSNNQLTSLEGAPSEVGRWVDCSNNQLTSLAGAPSDVGGMFACTHNQLTTLVGAPNSISNTFYCSNNPLESLQGMPTFLKKLFITYDPNLPLLRGLYAQEIELYPRLEDKRIETILNKYAGQGKQGVIRCQKELIAAGFEGNAKW